ncbi:E3 ubiquitin-protein ligase PPP1R11 [Amphibalanus amphitrite]|uniref:E3 ubiquitin-protein ligase PPP1R11 n=1 Tax=Amphibalanus amphitrite TaxID=1232801 RepID=A0A6A4V871_AMPAM|nr:E3 ubiquitin-protein ligase PPP1R11-like [Amphibalanus amphitrite]XP_043245362.1 E3 ubiquitin-protein ligase PPP1R11-like [Amphibalanus amphitrite]XP_043245363.1 E3 ubiquitin-protein ligase PPP1R11-like [Amphibalanus amphitrite]KAF0289349.1 E3 ubiquitin-protein ligase PPP1R11 [Amphibalanus amphitrite]
MSQPAPVEGETVVATETVTVPAEPAETGQPTLHLRLVRPNNPRRVGWQSGTIDNEHMNKKKSKCCCVYRKPKPFGESSSDEEDECKACIGHRQHKQPASSDAGQSSGTPQAQGSG